MPGVEEDDDDAGSTGAGEDVPFQGMGPSDNTKCQD